MHRPTAAGVTTPPLALVGHIANWRRLATALSGGGRPVLSDLLRSRLAATGEQTGRIVLSFVPAHAAAILRVACGLGISLAPSGR